jgi:hypothetical protein
MPGPKNPGFHRQLQQQQQLQRMQQQMQQQLQHMQQLLQRQKQQLARFAREQEELFEHPSSCKQRPPRQRRARRPKSPF